jgi:hypothetical protein
MLHTDGEGFKVTGISGLISYFDSSDGKISMSSHTNLQRVCHPSP